MVDCFGKNSVYNIMTERLFLREYLFADLKLWDMVFAARFALRSDTRAISDIASIPFEIIRTAIITNSIKSVE